MPIAPANTNTRNTGKVFFAGPFFVDVVCFLDETGAFFLDRGFFAIPPPVTHIGNFERKGITLIYDTINIIMLLIFHRRGAEEEEKRKFYR
jgi:hypothetical protein